MLNTTEGDVERRACDLVWKNLGIKGSKLAISGENSYPDRIFWLPGGGPLLIEFKRPGEAAQPIQDDTHDELRQLGYKVEVHDDPIDAFEAVINAVEATKVPKNGRQVLAAARRRCAVLRSRAG